MTWREQFVIALILIIFAILYGFYSQALQQLDTQDNSYFLLLGKIQRLQNENLIIRDEVLQNKSLTQIASKAASEGFVPIKSYVYLPN